MSDDRYLDVLKVALESLATDPEQARERAEGLKIELPPLLPRTPIPVDDMVTVFRHDRFTCRYCGSAVVPTAVLRATSLLWPERIPYNPNWRADVTHPIYPARSATVDHLVPHAQGGRDEIPNFVTACWPCNTQKSDLNIERLGWKVLDVPETGWDGLVIWSAVEETAIAADIRFHERWLTAFRKGGLVDGP
jgi:hypothetical protein